jgi:hypothetical protein
VGSREKVPEVPFVLVKLSGEQGLGPSTSLSRQVQGTVESGGNAPKFGRKTMEVPASRNLVKLLEGTKAMVITG